MTAREASEKTLRVLFGMKVPARRSRVRLEKPPTTQPSKWSQHPQEESLRKLKEVCERNRARAPNGHGLANTSTLMHWAEGQMRKHFADTETEEES